MIYPGELLLMDDEVGELQYTSEPEFTEEVQQPTTTTSKNKEVGSFNFWQMKYKIDVWKVKNVMVWNRKLFSKAQYI